MLAGNTEPEGGRGDSGYYLPGIGVAPRVSLAIRGGRDAPRVRRDQCTKLDAHIEREAKMERAEKKERKSGGRSRSNSTATSETSGEGEDEEDQ